MKDGILGLPFLTRDMLAFQEGKPFGIEIDIITDKEYIVTLKGFTKEGPFQYNTDGTQIDTMETFKFSVPDVPIMLTVEIKTLGMAMLYGKIQAYLTINGSRFGVLLQGNLNGCDVLSWPHQLPFTEIQKRGEWQVGEVDGPGNALSIVQNTGTVLWWRVKGISTILHTDANVANRRILLLITPGGAGEIEQCVNVIQTASTLINYYFIEGATDISDTTNGIVQTKLMSDLWLPPGSIIRVSATNMQAGDHFHMLRITGERHWTKTP